MPASRCTARSRKPAPCRCLTALFVMGRLLFWIGYHKNPYLRAFGFGITFYPTVMAFIWLILKMVFDFRIPL